MVDIIRRKDTRILAPDVSSSQLATAQGLNTVGTQLQNIGRNLMRESEREQQQAESNYMRVVQNEAKAEQARIADQKKMFDAADKMAAADAAGRLENDLLRWNLEQRASNPTFIGTPEHEQAMRDQYSRLANQYSKGLGEVGLASFQEKTQNKVNDFIGNDIKWAYQQKIKQGEQAAANAAQTLVDTAGQYGASGDIDGFKEEYSKGRQQLNDYANESDMANAPAAMAELDKNALVELHKGIAQTNPVASQAILESNEMFEKTVPEEMLESLKENNKQDILKQRLAELDAAIKNAPNGSPLQREAKQAKKQFLKDVAVDKMTGDNNKLIESLRNEVKDAVNPALKKSLGENMLALKKEKEQQKVKRFQEFMKLPTAENLKWFEEDNQMSYAPKEENMSKLPDGFFGYESREDLQYDYNIYKGRNELNITDMVNALGMDEDIADIEFFDKIDQYKKDGMSEDAAIKQVFDEHPNNKFNDVSTLTDFYYISRGEYDHPALQATKSDLKRVDELIEKGMSESDAIDKVFSETNAKIKKQKESERNIQLLENMRKYRENFGDVSMTEVSDIRGTQQTWENLKALAKTDADADGNTDNVLLQALETLNSGKSDVTSQADYNNLEKAVNRILFDRTGKEQIQQFMANVENFAPKHFWNSPSITGSNRTKIMEQFESRQRDVLRNVVKAYADGADEKTLTKMYIDGVQAAYNAVVNDFFGINMSQIEKDYAENGYATARIRGIDYLYKGTDPKGNPQWQPITDESAKALARVAPKIKAGSIF